jgi:hypothetical protein
MYKEAMMIILQIFIWTEVKHEKLDSARDINGTSQSDALPLC